MFGSAKRLKEKLEREDNEQRLKEVEQDYPIGASVYYLGCKVTVVRHHNKAFKLGCNCQVICTINPGVKIQWWSTTKDLRSDFIPYEQLKLLDKD